MNEVLNITSAQYIAEEDGSNSDFVKIVVDGVTMDVPPDTGNRHYQAILDWVADGNTIQDAD